MLLCLWSEISLFHKLIYHMFLSLWSEKLLFHKLIYNIAQGNILIGLDVAFCLWRHRQRPDNGAFSAVESLIKLCFSCIFASLTCDKKNLKWIFISYGIYETRCVFYIPPPKAQGYKTHNSFHKYRMKWKFISDPIFMTLRRGIFW